ncbi:MAG: SGNH/GDSL hydrolase family protein [Xanthobacteraceae bacterium]
MTTHAAPDPNRSALRRLSRPVHQCRRGNSHTRRLGGCVSPTHGRAAALIAGLLLSLAIPISGRAQTGAKPTAAEVCLAANKHLSLGSRLPRTAARLRAGNLRIVAIGSSSTTGLWMLDPDKTYPQVMRRELKALHPRSTITVINSGRVGDTIPANLRRFQRDVFAHRPDLVIWQLGTNDVAWGGHIDGLKERLLQGIRALKASGADVILMDLQFAPQVLRSEQHPQMEALIMEAARHEQVGLFSRFALMRRAIEAGLPPGELVSWDGLHNSASGYECVGRALARAIDAAAH